MTMTRATIFRAVSIAAFLLLHPRPTRAEEPRVLGRGDLQAFEAQLDKAVAEVSRPAPGIVLGRSEAARGYHLRGYGAVFVLSPRALPRSGDVIVIRRRPLPGGSVRIAPPQGGDGEEIAALEQEVLEFQQEAEQARQMAERDFERLTQDIRGRLAPPMAIRSAAPINAASPEPPPAAGAAPPPPAPAAAAPPAAPVTATPAGGPSSAG